VLSFSRFPDADTVLGPDAQHREEGIDTTFGWPSRASWRRVTGCLERMCVLSLADR
jgi:hypothetical protein